MHIPLLTLSLASLATAILPSPLLPQHIFSNPSDNSNHQFKIPTSYESAILARRIFHLTPHGTLSTIFPSSHHASEQRPSGLGGMPIGMMDYIADCEDTGNPTILAINIATSFKNAAAGSNISLSLQWVPPHLPDKRIQSVAPGTQYSAANLPRFSLLGYLEKIPEVDEQGLKECFVQIHPDSKYWLPGNRIHTSEWVRLVVQDVYWVGGFGDRAYIGWIDAEEWRNVSRKEWEDVRLPGEKKGWNEWAIEERAWEL
jgi:Pyridoxamine 5'-phosphate oxidase